MVVTLLLAGFAVLSVVLLAWQVIAASRFPLHRREADRSYAAPIVVLKPLKGCDEFTAECLRSWLNQNYGGSTRILFGVADPDDPACEIVRSLLKEFPDRDAELVITPKLLGPNAKVSNLAQLYEHAGGRANAARAERRALPERGELVCISDQDVRVPPDFLANAVAPFREDGVGLVNSFYCFAKAQGFAMEMEAIAVNADFWSQVLQSNTLKPQDFALGAVMITRARELERIGGFLSVVEYLADDYELGNRIAKLGQRIVLTPVVVECWDPPLTFRAVWAHQLRWARTIRASQPLPYFFSILNNVTLWGAGLAVSAGVSMHAIYRVAAGYPWHVDFFWIANCALVFGCCIVTRFAAVRYLVMRLSSRKLPWRFMAEVIAKDVLQVAIWAAAFMGRTVMWRGRRFRVLSGGKLQEVKS